MDIGVRGKNLEGEESREIIFVFFFFFERERVYHMLKSKRLAHTRTTVANLPRHIRVT